MITASKSERGRLLYQIVKDPSNMVLKNHDGMEEWVSAVLSSRPKSLSTLLQCLEL